MGEAHCLLSYMSQSEDLWLQATNFNFEPAFSYVMVVTDLEIKSPETPISLLPPHSKQLFQVPTSAAFLGIFLPSKGSGWIHATGAGVTWQQW